MADFDLVQTDAQVQSILNDGQSAMGAGAQTTLTTEYVMLKDTNGVYHKILKSSFTEAIRDTLAGLLVNNDKGTTIDQIAAIASGDFGSITPANLASVLGVNTLIKKKAYAITSNGTPPQTYKILLSGNRSTIIFQFNGNSSDRCGVYIINYASASWKIELLSYKNEYNQPTFYEDSEHNLYIKLNATWSNGVLYSSTDINSVTLESNDTSNLTEIDFTYIIPDFYKSYSNLSSLATALGAYTDKGNSVSDLDSLITTGRYRISNGSSVSHTPDTSGNTALIEVGAFADYCYQIYRVYNGNTYSRSFDGTVWKSWARVDNFGCKTLAELKAALAAV